MALNMTYLKSHLLVLTFVALGATTGYNYVSRPTIEGEIVSSYFSNKKNSELRIKNNETGSIDTVILETISGRNLINFEPILSQSYIRRAEELEQKLVLGQNIQIITYNDEEKKAFRIKGLSLSNDNYNVQSQRSETKKQTGLFNFN